MKLLEFTTWALIPLITSCLVVKRESDTKSFEVPLGHDGDKWFLQMGVGSQNFTARFALDTGSADVWLWSHPTPFCSAAASTAERKKRDYVNLSHAYAYGDVGNLTFVDGLSAENVSAKFPCETMFNPSISTSLVRTGKEMLAVYGGGSTFAYGEYANDTVDLFGHKTEGVVFGLTHEGNLNFNIVGLAPRQLETSYNRVENVSYLYDTFVRRMWSTGVISNYAFALNLNTTSRRGSIVLGGDGVDLTQIDGETITRPLDIYPNSPRYRITATVGVSVGNNSVLLPSDDYILDNGISGILLTSNITSLILSQFSTYVWQSNNFYLKFEEAKKTVFTLSFDLSSSVIVEIPIGQYIVDCQTIDGESYCAYPFEVSGENDGGSTLGTPFFDHAYTYFNIKNVEITIAKPKAGSAGSNFGYPNSTSNESTSASSSSSPSSSESLKKKSGSVRNLVSSPLRIIAGVLISMALIS